MSARLVSSLFSSTPDIHVAKKQLSYPLYGADFDPLNHHFLLVGGGGGSSSTGVPNRISLLDTSNRSEIKEVSDIELAPDEDSVVSLAVADSNSESLLAYAGINGSERDHKAGTNAHFRSFRVPLPAKRKIDEKDSEPAIATVVARAQPLARTSFFRSIPTNKHPSYQRVLRLSPPVVDDAGTAGREGLLPPPKQLKRRICTIASGLAEHNEVITFPVEATPSSKQTISRLTLGKPTEAGDVDITDTENTTTPFTLAYCTDHALFLQPLAGETGTKEIEPIQVHETQPGPEGRSSIRALRWLTPRYLLVLQNRTKNTGVELIVFRISQDYAQAQQVLVKYLKHMKKAVGLDTCTLSMSEDGSQQFVVAVAGQDSSIQIHTLNWIAGQGMTSFTRYADIIDVHSGPITRIVFSNFIPPQLPITGQTKPQYIRLATVGVDKNVIVQTLTLNPISSAHTASTHPRYVLTTSLGVAKIVYAIFMGVMALTLGLIFILTLLELRGVIPPVVGGTKYLPQRWREQYGQAYPYGHDNPGPVIATNIPAVESIIDKIKLSEATPFIEKLEEIGDRARLAAATPIIESLASMQTSIPNIEEVQGTLSDLVSQKADNEGEHADKAVIIRDVEHLGGEISAELKHEADIVKEGTLKKFESLSKQDQKTWKEKLKAAGQWTESQGETVLKGVFFGQIGQLVGQALAG